MFSIDLLLEIASNVIVALGFFFCRVQGIVSVVYDQTKLDET